MKSSPFPSAAGKVLLAAARVQTYRWNRALGRIQQEQERVLADILGAAAKTEFGRKNGFNAIRSHADYVRAVPVGDYDSFSPYIERMRAGEHGLLVSEKIRYYGNSSGSSNRGKPKFLPIGETQIGHQKRSGADTLMRYLSWSNDASFTNGFVVGLFPPITMKKERDTFITSNPALMMTRMPSLTRPVYLPADDVMRMTDYDEKLGIIAERYLDHDVRAVTGTTCWFTLLFEKVLAVARKRGRRADSISEIWPNLRVLLGGGVSATPYLPILTRLLGREDFQLVDTYNATEGGIYAASDFSGERGMLMLPHRGTFFEFVPLDERGKPGARRLPLWKVVQNQPYVIVVTTTSGLYSYEVGDIVRFTSVNPHRIEFVGRLSGCLSLTQELTTHVEIERAVEYAIAQVPCRTVDFGAGADLSRSKPGYVLYAEFENEPTSVDAFAAAFDEGLSQQNRVYREHRIRDVALGSPRVVPLVRGGAKRFLDETTGGNVQGKFPRILDDAHQRRVVAYTRSAPEHRSGS